MKLMLKNSSGDWTLELLSYSAEQDTYVGRFLDDGFWQDCQMVMQNVNEYPSTPRESFQTDDGQHQIAVVNQRQQDFDENFVSKDEVLIRDQITI